jgi:endonuclease YncB( thermonuclease family)
MVTYRSIAALLFFLACDLASAGTLTGVVVGVADGDTLTVLDSQRNQHKIRLAGIDAPEKRQDFGLRSKQSLSDLVYRREVTVETNKTDRYGREVGKVLLNGRDVNLEQIRRGLAWHYVAYAREQAVDDGEAKECLKADRAASVNWLPDMNAPKMRTEA